MKRDEIRTKYLILPSNLYLAQNKFLLNLKNISLYTNFCFNF